MKHLMKFIVLLLLLVAMSQCGLGLSAINPVASVSTTYTFGITLEGNVSNIINIQSGASSTIQFPGQYTGRLTSGAANCTLLNWGDPFVTPPTPSCSISGDSLTITNLFTSAYSLNYSFEYSIQVTGIKNPLVSGLTGNFYYNLYATAGPIIISATGVGISAATMTCSVAPTPTIVNSNGSLAVQFTTPEFQTTSTVQIDFSRYWPQANPQSQLIMPDVSSVTCSPGANAGSSISCAFTTSGTSAYTGTVSSIVSSNVQSTTIAFTFGSVMTPPTTKPQGSLLIIAREGTKSMSQCTTSVSGMTAGSLTLGALSAVNTTISTTTQLSISFVVNVNVVNSDVVRVTFPVEISIATVSQVYLPALGQFVTPSVSGQAINITGAVCASGSTLTLTFVQITNPASELATSTFSASTFRGGYQMDVLSGFLTYSATRSAISSASLSASPLQIGVSSTYTILFTLGQPLTASSAIVVGLPVDYQGRVGGCSPSPCTVSSSNVIFTNVPTTVSTAITLTLTSVTNPLTIGTTNSLTLYTLYSSSQATSIVEYTNTGLTVNLVARVIPSANIVITSTSQVVSYFPASFTLTITNVNQLPANVYLQVKIPTEITVSVSQLNCQVGSSAVSCSYDSGTRMITFSALSTAVVAAGGLASTPVVINNLMNPSTTSPTSSFGVYLLNTLNQIVEYQAAGLTFTSNQAASFYSLTIIPNNTINSASTSLAVKFSITASSYTNDSLLVIIFPSLIDIQLADCGGVSANLAGVSCSPNGQQMKALLTFSSSSTATATEITIFTYKNYPSLEPYTLQVDLYADRNKISKLNTNINNLRSLKNTAVGSITLTSYSFSSTQLLSTTNLNFEIGSISGLSFSQIKITFPGQFTTTGASCSSGGDSSCSLSGSTLIITSNSTIAVPLLVGINNIISPPRSPSGSIYLQTFSNTGYLMDSNTQIYFQTACTLPCKTCFSVSQPSTCTSCYTNASLVSGQIYFNSSTCVSVCSSGLYLQTVTNSCVLCVDPCATCASALVCYTCNSTTSFYNGNCLASCPFGYYSFNNVCLNCTIAIFCQSCPNSYACSSCISGYFYFQGLCYVGCPSDITYPNTVNRTCDPCPTNCSTCTGNSSSVTCTACQAGYVRDNNRCYSTCITAGLIAVSNVCQGCSPPCETCSVLVTNCTSCLANSTAPYLFGNRCLSICPNGYYEDSITFSCLNCTQPCQLCANISVHSCLSCITGYYLYLNDCLATCPSTFYNASGKCLDCASPCLTCTDYAICLSCTNSTYLYNGQCLNQCPGGMAVVNGNQCLVCLSTCKTCSSLSFCDSCYANTYLYNGTCISLCPSGTFPNSTALACQNCQPPCLVCLNNSYCLTCFDSSKFQQLGACIDCTSPCSSCSISVTNCTSCLSNTTTPYYHNFQCLPNCPSGYYSDNVTYSCSICQSPCLECSGATNSSCTSCIGNYYYLSNLCYAVCPSGFFSSVNVCTACVNPCVTCSSASVCLSCTNGTYLLGSSCVGSCGSGSTIINNSICSFCSNTCLSCLSANISACTSCYSGAFLDQTNQTCSSTCAVGFFPDSSSGTGLCVACITPCKQCISDTYCLSCLDNALFLVNGSCLSCSFPCLTCSGLRTNCTACDTNSTYPYLYSGQCNSACLFGYYSSSFLCVACSHPCASCNSGSSTDCLSCQSGYYQLNSSCHSPCPSGYFNNVTICSSCVTPCSTCSSASICLSCTNGTFLLGSTCVNNCSTGMAVINNSICDYCLSICLTCLSSNSSACTSCHLTTYLYASSCSTTCPNTTYADNTTSTCQPCVTPCSSCSSLTYCLSCSDIALFLSNGSCVGCSSPCESCAIDLANCTGCSVSTGYPYLLNNSCLASCPGGYYSQSSTGTCQICQHPCLTCSSLSTCLSCGSGYLLHLGSCLLTCPSAFYSNNIACLGCNSPCQNCQDNSTCTSCQGGLLLQGSSCVSNCSSGLIAINSTVCDYCNSSCASCLSANTSACTSCYSGLYLLGNACMVTCTAGFYPDVNTSTCLQCQHPCSTCTSLTICLTCADTALFLVNGSCLGCLTPCLTCSTLRTNCTSCDTTATYKYLVNNDCLSTCPSGTYPNGFQCTNCTSPCDSCFNGSSSSCFSCMPSYYLLNNSCFSPCPIGYYSNGVQCIDCTTPCSTCLSANICLSCVTGQYLLGSSCYANCPGGMVSTTVGNNSVCEYCSSSCATCLSANSSYCTSCSNGSYLLLGQCLANCSGGYYPNTAINQCSACVSPCATCTDASTCLSCALTDYFLMSGQCVACSSPCLTCSSSITTCASCNNTSTYPYLYQFNCLTTCPSTYYNSASYICQLCQVPCYTCSSVGNQSCLSCLSGYLLLNSTCYITCPGGYYNHSGYCLPCTSPCLECVSSGASACTSCDLGLYLLGSSCVSNCSGYAVNGSRCVFCLSSCLTCQTNNNSYCTSCSGLYLFNGECLTNCSTGYYPDSTLNKCMPCLSPCGTCTTSTTCLSCSDTTKFLINSTCLGCSSPCLTCSGSITNCTSCDPLSGYPLLFSNGCVDTCPSGYYQSSATSCTICDTPCSSCSTAGIHSCLSCLNNTYLLNSTCYASCPAGYYSWVDQCLICTPPCASCLITATLCLSCTSGNLLRGSACVTNCSTGQVVVNNTYCQVCTSNCLTCLSSNFSYCSSCSTGTYLSSGLCLSTCPNLTYADATLKCLSCVYPCLSCSSLSICTSCQSNLFLIGTTCQSCLSPCLTCTLTQTNCTSCNTSSTSPYYHSNGCLSSCPLGYYPSGSFTCQSCLNPCSTCSAGTNRSCLTCMSGYSQLGNDCYLVCPTAYYSNGTDCLACNSSLCLTCTLSASTCITCVSPLLLYGSTCVPSCPSGMTIINGSICQSCTSNCLTCLSSNTSYCTTCLTNNYVYAGTCSTTCPDYFFPDSASGSCIRCVTPCGKCTSDTLCTSCADPLNYVENYTCVSACTYPLVGINGTCYRCSSQCQTCTQTVSTCLLCASGFYYFPATFACELTCSFYIIVANLSTSGNNQCRQTCPDGTYPSSPNCLACPTGCSICSNNSFCGACISSYYLYSNYCYNPCPTVAPYAIGSNCIMCNISQCLTCQNTTHCSQCVDTYLLIHESSSSSCIGACPTGMEYNSTAYKCQQKTTTVSQTNIVDSVIPPYSILAGAAALTFVLFLIKFKYPSSQLVLLMFLMLNLANTVAIINIISIEASNNVSNISASTAIILTAGGVQLISSVGALIAVIKIRDPQLVSLWTEHPLSCMVIAVLCLVDINFLFITTSQILGLAFFQAKLASVNMVKVMKFGLCSSLLVKILTIAYSAIQLMYYSNEAYRLLQVANFPIQNGTTIEMLILSSISLLLITYLLCKISSSQDQNETKQQQSHASLMDEAHAFDKRNQSNAQIMMSIDNSDMIVDINSLKDEKEISEGEGRNLFFEDDDSAKSTKRLKGKKVTPDDMLKRMNGGIVEEKEAEQEDERNSEDEEIEVNLTRGDVFFVQPQQSQIKEKDNNEEQTNRKASETEQLQNSSKIDNNESRGNVVLIQENSVELFDSSHSKIAFISEIAHKDNPGDKSNIFDSELPEEDEKNRTEVLNFDKPDNDKLQDDKAKYSPSQISKYEPNPKITNQFAHNSYMDDAFKFNEHQFQKQLNEPQQITYEEVNKNIEEETPDEISFRKKGNFVEPTVKIIKERDERYDRDEKRKRQGQDIAQILEENDRKNVRQMEEDDQFRETPLYTPTRNPQIQTFVEDLQQQADDFRPSEGLRGKLRRNHRRKPDIPLPKNQAQKEIMNVYGKKNPPRETKKRYEMPPKQHSPSKRGNYMQYELQDNEFAEQKFKPIYSGQISKNPQTRYKRSLDLNNNATIEQDMPAKPSLKLRKSSFKKIGQMILDSESSARK